MNTDIETFADALVDMIRARYATRDRVFIREPDGARSNYWLNVFPTRDLAERDPLMRQSPRRLDPAQALSSR